MTAKRAASIRARLKQHIDAAPSNAPCPQPLMANIGGQVGVGQAQICYLTYTWIGIK
jgi:hypothetical protein